ncbi:hypothetical protein ACIBQ1_24835 [Nonomuraea sp. NPDC050153]|uniref:hypothetical protein n=1 Tax=Nonomuraea sp. NPDC050153 TaxID=3364359 RepID=UPI0037920020
MGTSRTSERRLRGRARRQAGRFVSVPPDRRPRLTERQRRRMARQARADAAQRSSVWREWGPVTAMTLVAFELIYFFLVADMIGGTSTAGVIVTAVIGCATVCSRFVQEYAMWRSTDSRAVPFLVVGVVSVAVALVAMGAETLSKVI